MLKSITIRNFVEFIYCYCGCQKTRNKYNLDGTLAKYIQGHNARNTFCEFVYCECGCQRTLPKYDKTQKGYIRRFINGHNGRGKNHWNYKGRTYTSNGYIKLLIPDYYSAVRGYVLEHRYVYEQYYNCCILPWIIIHHKNKIRDDNRIENLQPMTQSEHVIYHLTIDMSDRFCLLCPAETTSKWHHYGGGFICKRCYERVVKYPRIKKRKG